MRKNVNLAEFTADLPYTAPLKRVHVLQESKEKQLTRQHILDIITESFPNTAEQLKFISNAGAGNGAFQLEAQLATLYNSMQFFSLEFFKAAIASTQGRLKKLISKFGNRFSIIHAKNSELSKEEIQQKVQLSNGVDIIWNDGMCVFNDSVAQGMAAIVDAHARYKCFSKCWKNKHTPLIFLTVALKGHSKVKRLNKLAEEMTYCAEIAKGPLEPDSKVANLATGIWLYFNTLAKGHSIKFMPMSAVVYKSTPKLLGAPMLLICMKALPQEFQEHDLSHPLPEVKNFIYNQQVRMLRKAYVEKKRKEQMKGHFKPKTKDHADIAESIIAHIKVPTDPLTGSIIKETNYQRSFKCDGDKITSAQILKHRPMDGGIAVKELIS